MKGSGQSSIISLLLLLFAALSVAWPWPGSKERTGSFLIRRQESNNDDASTTASTETTAPTTTTTTDDAARTDEGATSTVASSDANVSVTVSTRISGSGGSQSTSRNSTKTTAIDPRLPPGGVQMVTPAPISGAQYYKVGDWITFAWNYTSLSVTPSAVDVMATCVTNSQMYTIAQNVSIDGPTQVVLWDTGDYSKTASVPFVVATYTLIIHDSAQDITAIPSAGYLGTYEQYQFGIYTPQPYTPLNDFKCATCNGAISDHERQALGVLFITGAITVLSFTWFAGGYGFLS